MFVGYTGDIGEILTIREQEYDVDAPSDRVNQKSTALYIACAEGHLEMVQYLASTTGLVDLNCRNFTGATPFFAACNRGHDKIVKVRLVSSSMGR